MINNIKNKWTQSTPSTLFPVFGALALGAMIVNSAPTAQAAELELDARALYEQSVSDNVKLSADGAVVLQQGVLIEDDGPAAGYTYVPNQETLSEDVWIKKELIIPNPAAQKAYLLLGMSGKSSTAQITINGKAQEQEPVDAKKNLAGGYWDVYEIDPGVLQAGKNEIVIGGAGSIWIARDEDYATGSATRTKHPNRSAKSTDGGKTWDYDNLGKAGDMDGEYYVRVFLEQHQPQGSLTLPVVDIGNLEGRAIPAALTATGPVRVAMEAENGQAGKVAVRVRSGSTYVPDARSWSAWQNLNGNELNLTNPTGRYLQIAADLTTSNATATPQLKQITVSATPQTGQWTEKLKVADSHNEEIVRTSIPFEYEPFDHPTLKAFREQYDLDEVVKGAESEFEMITRLGAWASQQFKRGHLGQIYPGFNALEILELHEDGTPVGGFCQHYNTVFLQACESFGLVGRAVSIDAGRLKSQLPRMSGHEVVEIWSNDYKKWVYVDGDSAIYLQDAETKEPMSLMEFRERKIAAANDEDFKAVNFIKLADTKYDWQSMEGMPPVYEIRLIPRSNFLEKEGPLPLHQGMRGWFWTGHYVYTDEKAPAVLLYGNRIEKRQNFNWTLNQAHYVLEPTATPGEVRVHLDTETPGFETFLADIDGAGKKPVDSGFIWKLKPGQNRLEVLPRNIAGREGIKSWIVLEYS